MNAHQQIKSVLAITLLLLFIASVSAQSGTRGRVRRPQSAPAGSATRSPQGTLSPQRALSPQGSSTKRAASPTVAMNGYCAVCLREKGDWVKGNRDHRVVYDNKIYYFPGEKQKEMFVAQPAKYAPAFGGDCLVCKVNMGQRVAGSVNFGVDYGGRFYFFPGAQQREMFKSNPKAYASSDLAFGGECAVCRVEMQRQVAGSDEFTVIHEGMRYLFPGPDQMKMFQANPARYALRTR